MKNLNRYIFCLLSLGLFLSCAMIQKLTCNSSVAESAARSDVREGRLDQPGAGRGDSCEGEYSKNNFRQDYARAFEDEKQKICTAENAVKAGQEDGLAGAIEKPKSKQFKSCVQVGSNKNLDKTLLSLFDKEFLKSYCSETRAQQIATTRGNEMAAKGFSESFASCEPSRQTQLQKVFDTTYQTQYDAAAKRKTEEFIKNTGTSGFDFAGRAYSAACRILADKSQLLVTINNPHPQQTLVQGTWKITYYAKDLQRLMDDTSQEAILLTNSNPKSFSKMTMPRDAEYCRAEFQGAPVAH